MFSENLTLTSFFLKLAFKYWILSLTLTHTSSFCLTVVLVCSWIKSAIEKIHSSWFSLFKEAFFFFKVSFLEMGRVSIFKSGPFYLGNLFYDNVTFTNQRNIHLVLLTHVFHLSKSLNSIMYIDTRWAQSGWSLTWLGKHVVWTHFEPGPLRRLNSACLHSGFLWHFIFNWHTYLK